MFTSKRILVKIRKKEYFDDPNDLLIYESNINNLDAILYLDSSRLFSSKHGDESWRLFKKTRRIGVHNLVYKPYSRKI